MMEDSLYAITSTINLSGLQINMGSNLCLYMFLSLLNYLGGNPNAVYCFLAGDKFLKTRKIQEAEEATRRARATKAVIRVCFPDNYILEANFHPSETFQSLLDLLRKVVSQPELSFYIYTTPPKKQIKDMSQDLYSVGFVPSAIVYFSYVPPKEDDNASVHEGPFLQEEILSLNGLEQVMPMQSAREPVVVGPSLLLKKLSLQRRNSSSQSGLSGRLELKLYI